MLPSTGYRSPSTGCGKIMARFRVYRIGREQALAIDLQSNLLDELHTRVMAPLVLMKDVAKIAHRLNPHFQIDGESFVMMTEFLTTIPVSEIGPAVADLSNKADEITAATDFLFQGF